MLVCVELADPDDVGLTEREPWDGRSDAVSELETDAEFVADTDAENIALNDWLTVAEALRVTEPVVELVLLPLAVRLRVEAPLEVLELLRDEVALVVA